MSKAAYKKIREGLEEILDGIRRCELDVSALAKVAEMHEKFTDAAIDELAPYLEPEEEE